MSKTVFRNAIKRGDVDRIRVMLAVGSITPGVWLDGEHPAVIAHRCGQGEMARFLVGNGWSLDAANPESGNTRLAQAIAENDFPSVIELLSIGANPNGTGGSGNMLSVAAGLKTNAFVVALLKAGAEVTTKALFEAVYSGNSESLKHLLDAGGDPNATREVAHVPPKVRSLLGIARNAACADVLLNAGACPFRAFGELGWSSLHMLTSSFLEPEDLAFVLWRCGVVDGGDSSRTVSGDTPLLVAVRAGRFPKVIPLVRAGASIAAENAVGESPLALLRGSLRVGHVTKVFVKRVEDAHALNESRRGRSGGRG